MGRAPCCEKIGLKKGRWTKEEDELLSNYIKVNGEGGWRSLPKKAGLLRCGKSCRLRWINYLRDDIKRGNISEQEEELITKLHASLGNRWSIIAGHMPGRTDNEIKNYWNSHLSRKITNIPKRTVDTNLTVIPLPSIVNMVKPVNKKSKAKSKSKRQNITKVVESSQPDSMDQSEEANSGVLDPELAQASSVTFDGLSDDIFYDEMVSELLSPSPLSPINVGLDIDSMLGHTSGGIIDQNEYNLDFDLGRLEAQNEEDLDLGRLEAQNENDLDLGRFEAQNENDLDMGLDLGGLEDQNQNNLDLDELEDQNQNNLDFDLDFGGLEDRNQNNFELDLGGIEAQLCDLWDNNGEKNVPHWESFANWLLSDNNL